jgi:spermidine/putrescine-binding protein
MMNTFTKLIIFWFLLTIPLTASSEETTMNFVRIDESSDQTVGEKLLYEIYKRAGIEITITPMPAKRALIEASDGRKTALSNPRRWNPSALLQGALLMILIIFFQ